MPDYPTKQAIIAEFKNIYVQDAPEDVDDAVYDVISSWDERFVDDPDWFKKENTDDPDWFKKEITDEKDRLRDEVLDDSDFKSYVLGLRHKKAKYIFVLNSIDGRVYKYDVPVSMEEYEDFLGGMGHSVGNIEWMVTDNDQILVNWYVPSSEESSEEDEVDTQAAVKDPNTPSSTLTSKASTGSKEKVIPQNTEKNLKEVARNLLEEIQSGDEDEEMDEMESRVQQWIDDYPEPRK